MKSILPVTIIELYAITPFPTKTTVPAYFPRLLLKLAFTWSPIENENSALRLGFRYDTFYLQLFPLRFVSYVPLVPFESCSDPLLIRVLGTIYTILPM